jgi:hypothetical protein
MKKGSDVSGLIEKAHKSVHGAEVLLKEGLYDFLEGGEGGRNPLLRCTRSLLGTPRRTKPL